MPRGAEAKTGRLLRVLLLRFRPLPADPGARRAREQLSLLVVGEPSDG